MNVRRGIRILAGLCRQYTNNHVGTMVSSTGYSAFQASKPPSRAKASMFRLLSCCAARTLVASLGQAQ